MTRNEIIQMLADEYAGQSVTPARVNNLAQMTAHVEGGLLLKAAQEYMKTGKYFPRVSEFLEAVQVAQRAAEFAKRQAVDVTRYWHNSESDGKRLAYEQSVGLMRPTDVIEAEIKEARQELQSNPRFVELVNYRRSQQ